MTITLRPYQQKAIDSLYRYFHHHTGNPLVVVPTAGGKSILIASFCERALREYPDSRILVVTHVKELIQQNHDKMLAVWPEAPAGIYSAGLARREADAPILFAGIQSIYQKASEIGHADLCLIDEAHLLPRAGMGRYRTFLQGATEINPKLKVVGFTATPFRTDSGLLHEGDDRIFQDVAYDISVVELIEAGYLAPLVPKHTKGQIDTSGVHMRLGEFKQDELERAALQNDRVRLAIEEILRYGADRKSWLAFCCGVEHAETVAACLVARGIEAKCLFGHTPRDERDELIRRFRAGELRCLVNVGVLTTGFDAPEIDLLAILRPTCSPGLWIQMLGRGMRIAPAKKDTLVLDFGGNTMRHGPIDCIRPVRNKQQAGKGRDSDDDEDDGIRAKACAECMTLAALSALTCPTCGHPFPARERSHDIVADDRPLIAGTAKQRFQRFDVRHVIYSRHEKPGKLPSLRVEYLCGLRQFSEWVCLEHDGFARMKAERWWRDRCDEEVPSSVAEALACAHLLRQPHAITVDVDAGEFPRIVSHAFARHRDPEGQTPAGHAGLRRDDREAAG